MQIQMTTDYAIRIVVYLHENEGTLMSAKKMAKELGISSQYFMKVVERLKQASIVQSIRGCNGGYQLSRSVDQITLYDIVCAMQGEIRINRCFSEDRYCSRGASETCGVHRIFEEIQNELIDSLTRKRISDITL